ncbi:Hypp480 [Branchiostoma lanceolatum]|uniref:Hypp480 protein n=1 Tax=Branchiostoma lanceolatum TaxID=7740 RepID=A0A8J9VV66_BRALA|nr:Hypp480 [Branchiostoma lanceolatum]
MSSTRAAVIILMMSLATSSAAEASNEDSGEGSHIGLRVHRFGSCAEAVFRRCSALLEAMYRLPAFELRGLAGMHRFCDTEQAYMRCVAKARHCHTAEMTAVKRLVVGLSMVATHPYCPDIDYSTVLQYTGAISLQCTSLEVEMCLIHELTSAGTGWDHCSTRPMSFKCYMDQCLVGDPTPSQLTAASMMAKVMGDTFREDTCHQEEESPEYDLSTLYEG